MLSVVILNVVVLIGALQWGWLLCSFVNILPGPNVIKNFTVVTYPHSMVIQSICVIMQHYLGNYCGIAVNYLGINLTDVIKHNLTWNDSYILHHFNPRKSRVKITAVSYRDISITLDPDLQYRLGLSLSLFFGKVNNEKWFFIFYFFIYVLSRSAKWNVLQFCQKIFWQKKNVAVFNYFFVFICQLFLQGFETFQGALTFVRITHALKKIRSCLVPLA